MPPLGHPVEQLPKTKIKFAIQNIKFFKILRLMLRFSPKENCVKSFREREKPECCEFLKLQVGAAKLYRETACFIYDGATEIPNKRSKLTNSQGELH